MATVFVKQGVGPRIIHIAVAVCNVAHKLGETTAITAGCNGKHKTGSLHYKYRALDIRVHSLQNPQLFFTQLKAELGPDYDVIFEAAGTPNAHIHAEYDPK